LTRRRTSFRLRPMQFTGLRGAAILWRTLALLFLLIAPIEAVVRATHHSGSSASQARASPDLPDPAAASGSPHVASHSGNLSSARHNSSSAGTGFAVRRAPTKAINHSLSWEDVGGVHKKKDISLNNVLNDTRNNSFDEEKEVHRHQQAPYGSSQQGQNRSGHVRTVGEELGDQKGYIYGFPKIFWALALDVLAMAIFIICIPWVLYISKRRRPESR